MSKHLIDKLGSFTQLSAHDEEVLARLSAQQVRHFVPSASIIEEDEKPNVFYVIQEGWACGYKALANGRRQIIAFFLPGDICHLNLFALDRMDHSIGTITPVVVSEITQHSFDDLVANFATITKAMYRESLVNAAIQREWTVNVAQRGALERVAHLVCELFLRLESVGLTNGDSCEFPLTQTDIGDALGLTAIHVNRMLQQLRSSKLLVLKDRVLTVPDVRALQRVAGFNANYLHLSRERAQPERE